MSRSSFAILFDMDGVIVDSNPYHKTALREFCEQHGYTLTEEELRAKIYGRTNRDWIRNVFGALPDEIIKRYADEKEAIYRRHFEQDIKPVTGLPGFLELLDREKISRAIATSAPRINVDFTLSKTALTDFFPVILDESFVLNGKPDPEIYLKSAEALGYRPQDCIVIEDSLSGIEAGKRAGAKVIAVSTTHTASELSHADLIIDNFVGLEISQLSTLLA
jgi:HAD superfamily hydrolase (TIGR01509 family)